VGQSEMSRRPPRFQEIDVTRALRAAQKVGGAWAVEIEPDGTIRIVPADPIVRQNRKLLGLRLSIMREPHDPPPLTASNRALRRAQTCT
jgi:hypothetical protein